ncbi:MAG: conjugal transfer protein TraG N-terminal domain-containing protein [Aquabacterium sp.]
MAVADYTFFTYGDVNGMYGMLNGVVLLMGSNAYNTIVHLMLLLGGVLMMLYMMGVGVHAHRGWKWLVTVTMMSSIMFGPKSTVAIEDATGIQSPAIIENVPTALAFFFGVKSSAGYKLTEMAETAFQTLPPVPPPGMAAVNYTLPAELAYLKNGMMFGARVMESSRSAMFIDPTIKSLVVNYVKDCVIPSMGHLISYNELMTSTNVWETMQNTNKALFGTALNAAGDAFEAKPCDVIYKEISPKLDGEVNKIISRMGKFTYPNAPAGVDAGDLIRPAIVATYAKSNLIAASATANSIILQNAVINTMGDAAGALAVQMGDMSSILQAWAKQQSTASLNASLIAQGETVGAALPIAKNILDMLMIAAFPVVCLLLLATEGEMLRSLGTRYIMAMVWTELWPFLYAAVSFIGNTYASQRMAGLGILPSGNGLAMINADAIYSGTISDLAMVGWAMTLVPVISGAIVYGFDRMVSSGGGIGALATGAGTAAGSAAAGNLSGGIVNFDKYDGAMMKTDPAMVRRDTVSGVSYENVMNPSASASRWEARTGSSPVTMTDVMEIANRNSAKSSLAYSQGENQLASARAALSTNLTQAIRLAEGKGDSQTAQRLAEASNAYNIKLSANEQDSVVNEMAANLGIRATESNKRVLAQALNASMEISAKTPGEGLVPTVGASLKHSLQWEGSRTNDNTIENALQKGVKSARLIQIGRAADIAESARQSTSFTQGDESAKRLSDDLGADLVRAREFTKAAEVSFKEAKEYGQSAESIRAEAAQFGFNWIGYYNSFAYDATGRDPNTLSREEHQRLLPQFIEKRTMPGRDDDGPFLALNLFRDIAKMMPGENWRLSGSDTYSPSGLEAEFNKGATKPLPVAPPSNRDENAAAVLNQFGRNEKLVRGQAQKVGLDDTDSITPPAEVGAPGTTTNAAEVRAEAQARVQSGQERVTDDTKNLDRQQKTAAERATGGWDSLSRVETNPMDPTRPSNGVDKVMEINRQKAEAEKQK